MYGDPQRLREMARELDHEAERTRSSVSRLLGRVRAVRWQSPAADSMRSRASECADDLSRIASCYDVAAACVRRHADQVECRMDELRWNAAGSVRDASGASTTAKA